MVTKLYLIHTIQRVPGESPEHAFDLLDKASANWLYPPAHPMDATGRNLAPIEVEPGTDWWNKAGRITPPIGDYWTKQVLQTDDRDERHTLYRKMRDHYWSGALRERAFTFTTASIEVRFLTNIISALCILETPVVNYIDLAMALDILEAKIGYYHDAPE